MPWGPCRTCEHLGFQVDCSDVDPPQPWWNLWYRKKETGFYCSLSKAGKSLVRYPPENTGEFYSDSYLFFRPVYPIMASSQEELGNRGCDRWLESRKLQRERTKATCAFACAHFRRRDPNEFIVSYYCAKRGISLGGKPDKDGCRKPERVFVGCPFWECDRISG